MKKIISTALAMTLMASIASADVVQWQSNGKKFTYAVAGIGALVSFGGKYSQSIQKDSVVRHIVGGAVITLAAHILFIQAASDITKANRQLVAAEHRGLVRYAKDVKPNEERFLNSNFDDLLSEFECDLDDSEKAVVFADLIKRADELGAAAQAHGALTEATEAQIQADLEKSLGAYNTIRNQILIKYIIAQSFLSRAPQAAP